jgi:hypothetical protein
MTENNFDIIMRLIRITESTKAELAIHIEELARKPIRTEFEEYKLKTWRNVSAEIEMTIHEVLTESKKH